MCFASDASQEHPAYWLSNFCMHLLYVYGASYRKQVISCNNTERRILKIDTNIGSTSSNATFCFENGFRPNPKSERRDSVRWLYDSFAIFSFAVFTYFNLMMLMTTKRNYYVQCKVSQTIKF